MSEITRLLVTLNRSGQLQRKCPLLSKEILYIQSNKTLQLNVLHIFKTNTYMLACCEQQRTKTMPETNIAIQVKSCCISFLLPYNRTLGTTKQNKELD